MSLERENPKEKTHTSSISSPTDEILDIVVLIGIDTEGYAVMQDTCEKLTALCKSQQLKFRILGDGKTLVDMAEIEKLPRANHLVIQAHGSVSDGEHTITLCKNYSNISLEILQKIQESTNVKNMLVCACYGGKIIDDAKNSPLQAFLNGTTLLAPSAEDEISLHDNNEKMITNFIKKIFPSQKISMFDVVVDMIITTPDSKVFAHQPYPKNETSDNLPLESHTMRRTDRRLYINIEAFCEYQLNDFKQFIKEKLFAEKEISRLQLKMTPEEIEAYQESSLNTHVTHNHKLDREIIDTLLQKTRFGPGLLATAIAMHRIPHDHKNMEDMVQIILNHLNNVILEQTVNSFAPKKTDWKPLIEKHGKIVLTLKFYTPLTLALADKEFKIDGRTLIAFEPTNHAVVKVLLDHGADMYLPDLLGRTPARFLINQFYQSLFVNELKELKEVMNRANCAEIFLNKLNEPESLSHSFLINQIKEVLHTKDYLNFLCARNKDANFFNGEYYPPQSKIVFEAYKNYLEAANKINITDLLDIAKKRDTPDLLNTLLENVPDTPDIAAYKKNLEENKHDSHDTSLHVKLSKFPAKKEADVKTELSSVKNSISLNKK